MLFARGHRLASAGLVVATLLTSAVAQVSFERTYGGALIDECYSVLQAVDGGYVLLGHSRSFGGGGEDVWLVRTDTLGETLWTREYGGAEYDYGQSMVQTSDSGYAIAGITESFGAGNEDVYLIRTDMRGDTLWTRTYGGEATDEAYSVRQTTDRGFIIAGRTSSYAGGANVYLVKTDSAGDTLWTRYYGGVGSDRGRSVLQTADGGYVVVGPTTESTGTKVDVMLIKTNAAGDSLWGRTYGGDSTDDYGYAVLQAPDGGFFVIGYTQSFGAGRADVYVIRTDSLGDTLWTRCYGGTEWDEARAADLTADGDLFIAGYTQSAGAGAWDVYVLKIDAQGETLWTKTFGGAANDHAWAVQATADGGAIVGGITLSFGAGSADMYLIKTDPAGYVAVNTPRPEFELTAGGLIGSASLFTSVATLRYALTVAGPARLQVRDISGRIVRTLENGFQKPGVYTATWNGRDERGREVPKGVYFVRVAGSSAQPVRVVKTR
jgi:hypothetical protein